MTEIRWGGQWRIPEITFLSGGELFIDEENGIIQLTAYYDSPRLDDTSIFPFRAPIIWGELSNGAKVTLVNCNVLNRHSNNFEYNIITIQANYLLVGDHYAQDQLGFDKFTFQFSNIIEWSDLCFYKLDNNDGYKWNNKGEIVISLSNNSTARFYAQHGGGYAICFKPQMTIEQHIYVEISYAKQVTLEESLLDADSISGLISLAVEDNIFIEKVECSKNDVYTLIGELKVPRRMQAFIGRPQSTLFNPMSYYYLFDLPAIASEGVQLEVWFQKYSRIKPIIDLYTTYFKYPQLPIEIQFLNIVQALETYHSRFLCEKLKDYKKRVDYLLTLCPDGSAAYYKIQLLSDTQLDKNINYVILKSRLCDLALCEFHYNFFDFFCSGFPYDYIDAIIDTRHYFTHYGKSKEAKALKGLELSTAIRVLRLIMEYYFLKEIGFSSDFISKAINKRKGNLKMSYQREQAALRSKDAK